jgi:hypothetical protein
MCRDIDDVNGLVAAQLALGNACAMSSGLVRLLKLNNQRTAKFQIFGKATLHNFTDAFIRSE